MRKIHKKWQLLLYGFAGMGVNMLNLIVGSYLCDALMTEGFDVDIAHWTYAGKTLVVAAVWSVMVTIAKIVDGLIDIPFAALTDNFKSRWGKRRPMILFGWLLMVLAYIGFLNPLGMSGATMKNTIYLGIMLCLFYSFYTLTMVTYYATFSEIVGDDAGRLSLSNFKTVFDVVYFVLGYALIPALIGAANIRTIAWIFLPLALTMMIPMFMIKEDSTLPADVEKRRTEAQAKGETLEEEETVAIIPSIKYTLKNKPFVLWMLVYCLLEFGLQMYLAGQNVYYSGVLKLSGLQITMLMALTFAPVPFTLLLYNRIVKRRGIRTGYAYSLIVFIIAMLMMAISGTGVFGEGTLKMVIVAIASVVSSFGIGCFFSINYTIPATLAAIEKEQTGISHPAMYFAIQGLASGVATAISTGLVWVNLKRIGDGSKVYLMPFIIALAVFLSLVMSKTMPKEIDRIGKETK